MGKGRLTNIHLTHIDAPGDGLLMSLDRLLHMLNYFRTRVHASIQVIAAICDSYDK